MDDIEVLRQFDLEGKYGPCLGLDTVFIYNQVDTGRKLNVHKTFNLRPVSTGIGPAFNVHNEILGRNPTNVQCSRPYHFKVFKGCLPQNLLIPLSNTLFHV